MTLLWVVVYTSLIHCQISYGQRAKPGNFPWRFRIITASNSDNVRAEIQLAVYLDSASKDFQNVRVPKKMYEPGESYGSLQKLTETGMTAAAVPRLEVSARAADCSQGTTKRLVIQEISFTSFHKKQTFKKSNGRGSIFDVVLKCGTDDFSTPVQIDGFQTLASDDCYYQGEFYDTGTTFDIGCEMRCRCEKGMVDCDSMCKAPASPPPSNCRYVSSDRHCCDEVECMEDALWDSCPIHMAVKEHMPPWAVTVLAPLENTTDSSPQVRTCGASIIHKRFLLTSAHCITSADLAHLQIKPSSGNVTVSGRVASVHIHPEYDLKSAGADLAVIEITSPGLEFSDSTAFRRIDLPWSNLCKRYVNDGCALQYTTVDEADAYIGSVSSSVKLCEGGSQGAFPKERTTDNNSTDHLFCLKRMAKGGANLISKCDQENGNGVATKRGQYYYIVGVVARDYKKSGAPEDTATSDSSGTGGTVLFSPRLPASGRRKRAKRDAKKGLTKTEFKEEQDRDCKRQYVPVTSLCPHIQWLKNVISERV